VVRLTESARSVTEEESFSTSAHAYKVALPQGGFEGPLDLLLHLCQKHELDILDIPISFVTEKYLEYLAVMQMMDLDVAAEYLVMAATLAHIKSKMLLPAPPPGQEDEIVEEEEDPREALIRRLLEYQKYKKAGEDLLARGVAGRDVFTRGAAMEEAVQTGLPPLAQVPLFRLVEAFQGVLSKSKVKIAHDVVADRISITDRIHELADVMRSRRRMVFEDLFAGMTTRFDLVITFLALLEMTRLRMTRLYQTEPLSPLYVELAADDTIAPPANGELPDLPENDAAPAVEANGDTAASEAAAAPIDAPDASIAAGDASSGDAADASNDAVDLGGGPATEPPSEAHDTIMPGPAPELLDDAEGAPLEAATFDDVGDRDTAFDDGAGVDGSVEATGEAEAAPAGADEGDRATAFDESIPEAALDEGDRATALDEGDRATALDEGDRATASDEGDRATAFDEGDRATALDEGIPEAASDEPHDTAPPERAGAEAVPSEGSAEGEQPVPAEDAAPTPPEGTPVATAPGEAPAGRARTDHDDDDSGRMGP